MCVFLLQKITMKTNSQNNPRGFGCFRTFLVVLVEPVCIGVKKLYLLTKKKLLIYRQYNLFGVDAKKFIRLLMKIIS